MHAEKMIELFFFGRYHDPVFGSSRDLRVVTCVLTEC